MAKTTIHKNGSVTIDLSPDEAACLGDTLREWKSISGWTRREDCQNWKRSPIAQENRRESIVYQNCLSEMMASLGRRQMLQLMKRAENESKKDDHAEQKKTIQRSRRIRR